MNVIARLEFELATTMSQSSTLDTTPSEYMIKILYAPPPKKSEKMIVIPNPIRKSSSINKPKQTLEMILINNKQATNYSQLKVEGLNGESQWIEEMQRRMLMQRD